MSFIVSPNQITNPQNVPVTLTANSAGPYLIGLPYSWQITNLDSYVTYTASGNPSGSASVNTSTGVLTYVPATGDAGFLINNRAVNLTLTTPVGFLATLGGASVDAGQGIAVDASGNVYVVGYSDASGTSDFQLAKYNNSGTIQWQRRLAGAANDVGYGIAVDASGNVYVVGYSDASGTNDFQLAKYNTSGTIQWQRRLGGASVDQGYGIAVDASGNVYVAGYSDASGTGDFLLGKFPGDGSGTGTITVGALSFTYAASTLTDAATTLTDAATTLTDAVTTLTDAATTLTDAASTLTSTTGLF